MGRVLSADGGLVASDHNPSATFAVSAVRSIKAEPDRVFKAFQDPQDLNEWFTKGAVVDFRVGGRYENQDGDSGEFLEIDSPRLLAFTWEQPEHEPGSSVRVELTRRRTATAVSIEHLNLASFEEVCDLNIGWNWALDSLKHYLEEGSGIAYADWKAKREAAVAIS